MARAGLTPDRVVRTAADLADEIGFENITVSALARGFGVTDASLYSHVDSVQTLRVRIAQIASRELANRLSSALAGRVGKDALTAFAYAYREFALRYPGRYMSLQMLPRETVGESVEHRRVTEYTYAMLQAYELSEPDLTDAVRLLRSAFHGYASLEAMGAFSDPRDVRASWQQAVEALHASLSSAAERSAADVKDVGDTEKRPASPSGQQ
ncbi:TetR/AcrR family transcriptional regulator [Streptomyces sp. NPDC018000]|uniref:TetR/AcrR family transcriptional regulator n=1 Tax=Streptomyces sp. NPDC018000 TaxID=3365028 RepID=UPI0037997124